MKANTLNAKNFGLAAGILWAVMLFIGTFIAMLTGWSVGFLNLFIGLYPGYSISIIGAFIGAMYGFIDAFIGCYIFIWLYNWLQKKKS